MEQHEPQLTRESSLFRYSAALERGDFETVAAILQQAEDDAILAQMIFEVNDVYATELEPTRSRTGLRNFVNRIRRGEYRPTRSNVAVAVGVMVLVLLFLPILPSSRTQQVPVPGIVAYTPDLYAPPLASSTAGRRLSVAEWLSQQVRSGERSNAGQSPSLAVAPTLIPPAQPTLFSGYDPFTLPTATLPATSAMIEVTPMGGPTFAFTATPADALAPGTPASAGTTVPVQQQERMIVKNGEIDLLVTSANTAIDQVTQIATDNGGYVLSSQTYLDGPAKYATLTIAVRADQFETAMRRLRQSAIEVLRELSSGQDVSTEYVDLQSRLRNLEVTRDRIQTFLDQAKTVQEALEINRQLADIESQIEQVKGRMTYLSGRSAFSTITVNIQEKIDATPTATPTVTPTPTSTPPWSLGPTFKEASETQINLARGLLEVLTWVVVVPGPYCIAGGLVAWGIWAYRRRKTRP
jgi:hypothetical protein